MTLVKVSRGNQYILVEYLCCLWAEVYLLVPWAIQITRSIANQYATVSCEIWMQFKEKCICMCTFTQFNLPSIAMQVYIYMYMYIGVNL